MNTHLLACLASLMLLMLPSGLRAEPQQEIVRLKVRGDVEMVYLLQHERTPPKAVAVLITGGYGLLKLRATEAGVTWEKSGSSFLVINKDLFIDNETAIAVIDVPSDQASFGYTPKFRKSAEHIADLRGIVQDLRTRFQGAKIFLIGTSQGTTSAAYAGKAMGREIDGIVLTATMFDWAPASWRFLYDSNLNDFDFSQITAPLLMVHHVDDNCVVTPFASAAKFLDKHPFIVVKGGEPVRDNGCGPLGPHGFLGREEAVATAVKHWLHGRPYTAEIR